MAKNKIDDFLKNYQPVTQQYLNQSAQKVENDKVFGGTKYVDFVNNYVPYGSQTSQVQSVEAPWANTVVPEIPMAGNQTLNSFLAQLQIAEQQKNAQELAEQQRQANQQNRVNSRLNQIDARDNVLNTLPVVNAPQTTPIPENVMDLIAPQTGRVDARLNRIDARDTGVMNDPASTAQTPAQSQGGVLDAINYINQRGANAFDTFNNALNSLGTGILDSIRGAKDALGSGKEVGGLKLPNLGGFDTAGRKPVFQSSTGENGVVKSQEEFNEAKGASNVLSKAQENYIDALEKGAKESNSAAKREAINNKYKTSNNPVVRTLGDLNEAIAGQLPYVAMNAIPGVGQVLAPAMRGLTSSVNAYEEARAEGASKTQAQRYAGREAINQSLGEILIEGIAGLDGGILGKTLARSKAGRALAKAYGTHITSPLAKTAIKYTGKMLGEGVEEMLQDVVSNINKRTTYDPNAKLSAKEVAYSGLLGGLMAGVFNAPNIPSDYRAYRSDFDTVNSMSQAAAAVKSREEARLLNLQMDILIDECNANLGEYAMGRNEEDFDMRARYEYIKNGIQTIKDTMNADLDAIIDSNTKFNDAVTNIANAPADNIVNETAVLVAAVSNTVEPEEDVVKATIDRVNEEIQDINATEQDIRGMSDAEFADWWYNARFKNAFPGLVDAMNHVPNNLLTSGDALAQQIAERNARYQQNPENNARFDNEAGLHIDAYKQGVITQLEMQKNILANIDSILRNQKNEVKEAVTDLLTPNANGDTIETKNPVVQADGESLAPVPTETTAPGEPKYIMKRGTYTAPGTNETYDLIQKPRNLSKQEYAELKKAVMDNGGLGWNKNANGFLIRPGRLDDVRKALEKIGVGIEGETPAQTATESKPAGNVRTPNETVPQFEVAGSTTETLTGERGDIPQFEVVGDTNIVPATETGIQNQNGGVVDETVRNGNTETTTETAPAVNNSDLNETGVKKTPSTKTETTPTKEPEEEEDEEPLFDNKVVTPWNPQSKDKLEMDNFMYPSGTKVTHTSVSTGDLINQYIVGRDQSGVIIGSDGDGYKHVNYDDFERLARNGYYKISDEVNADEYKAYQNYLKTVPWTKNSYEKLTDENFPYSVGDVFHVPKLVQAKLIDFGDGKAHFDALGTPLTWKYDYFEKQLRNGSVSLRRSADQNGKSSERQPIAPTPKKKEEPKSNNVLESPSAINQVNAPKKAVSAFKRILKSANANNAIDGVFDLDGWNTLTDFNRIILTDYDVSDLPKARDPQINRHDVLRKLITDAKKNANGNDPINAPSVEFLKKFNNDYGNSAIPVSHTTSLNPQFVIDVLEAFPDAKFYDTGDKGVNPVYFESEHGYGFIMPIHVEKNRLDRLNELARSSGYDYRGGETKPTKTPITEVKPEEKPKKQEQTETAVEPADTNAKAAKEIADWVKRRLDGDHPPFSKQDLQVVSNNAYGGTQAQGAYTVKDMTDALELGINEHLISDISENKDEYTGNANEAKATLKDIEQFILAKIPTQTNRTEGQIQNQQFSTPPNIAFVANWVANIDDKDTVLEPSAGVGGLASFGKGIGAKVYVNEWDPRRLSLIKQLPFDGFYQENAEQIDNILPDSIKPTVVVMNPPFSANGRTKNNTKNAIPHIEQALERLQQGGRLVAILGGGRDEGGGMSDSAPSFKAWWNKLREDGYNIRANIGIDGSNYSKYGTSFNVRLVVIDKTGNQEEPTLTGEYKDLSEAIDDLEDIRNDRQRNGVQASAEVQSNGTVKGGRSTSESGAKPGGRTSDSGKRSPDSGESNETGRDNESGRTSTDIPSERGGGNSGKSEMESEGTENPVQVPDGERESGRGREPSVNGGSSESGERDERPGGMGFREPSGGTFEQSGQLVPTGSGVPGATGEVIEDERTEPAKKRGPKKAAENDDGVYAEYRPADLPIKGAKKHPAKLVESSAMSAVQSPPLHYKPKLDQKLIESGAWSDAQLENIAYAGQAHSEKLPSGERKGYFVGDGTGVGKGRQIAGIIMDNFNQGRKKAVWISENFGLIEDAKRDWRDVGGDENDVFSFSDSKKKTAFPSSGIMFLSYDTLRSKSTKTGKSNLDLVEEWLGKNFDGVIIFDEAHNMGNLTPVKGARGKKKPAAKAIAGDKLQKDLPNARVAYFSATGATNIENLSYASRLGLWGTGTSFESALDFVSKIGSAGISAMELVARDMKAMGVYLARSISYDGVTYDSLNHNLTPLQVAMYDRMSEGWQVVLQNFDKAMEATGSTDAKEVKQRRAQAYSNMQMFYNQILTSMAMPSVIQDIEKELKDGHSAVIQLVNTNEAAQDREVQKMKEEGGDLDDLDITPRQLLVGYVENAFPIYQYEAYLDENGNTQYQVVTDSAGNPVVNKKALKMKEDLIADLNEISIPEGPLDMLINHFGVDQVAEVTGRSQRVVNKTDETGNVKKVLERRNSKQANIADAQAFQDGKKRILVFSNAGSTGRSFHADKRAKNQQKRIHYVLQPGWRADKAVQGFGRTHRSNQVNEPIFRLVSTDVKGHKRFVTSIARRLDQLGALTKGQRQTGSGVFGEKDNLESPLSVEALKTFYKKLGSGYYSYIDGDGGLDAEDVLHRMGLDKYFYDEYGNFNVNTEKAGEITTFLNRLLALPVEEQNKVFDAFERERDKLYNEAIENGTLDTGLENVKADKIEITDEEVVYTDPKSGAETKYVRAKLYNKPRVVTTIAAAKDAYPGFTGIYRMPDGSVKAAYRKQDGTDSRTGEVYKQYLLVGPNQGKASNYRESTLKANCEEIPKGDWQSAWDEEVKSVPEYNESEAHMITGALLPIWNKLPQDGNIKARRITASDGSAQYLGRIIPPAQIESVLRQLDVGVKKIQRSAAEIRQMIMGQGKEVTFNGQYGGVYTVGRKRVSNENRMEITGGNTWVLRSEFPDLIQETIQYQRRYFIPDSAKGEAILQKLIDKYGIRSIDEEQNSGVYYSAGLSRGKWGDGDTHTEGAVSKIDNEYKAAIKNKDRVKARQIIYKAARDAGYLYHGYHGSMNPERFTKFKPGMRGEMWFSSTEGSAYNNRPQMYDVFLKMDNPYEETVYYGSDSKFDPTKITEEGRHNGHDGAVVHWRLDPHWVNLNIDLINPKVLATDDFADMFLFMPHGELRKSLAKEGETLVDFMKRGISEDLHQWFVTYRPEQIKSAEIETRDDNGKLILPSQRFDYKQPDMRYSKGLSKGKWKLRKRQEGEVLSISELVDEAERIFRIPINVGKMGPVPRSVQGLFKEFPETIRTRQYGDLPTIAHEIGHWFDKKYRLRESPYIKSVISEFQEDLEKAGYKSAQYPFESVAEYFREYLSDREATEQKFRQFTNWMYKTINPTDQRRLAEYSGMTNAYFAADLDRRASAQVHYRTDDNSVQKKAQVVAEELQRNPNEYLGGLSRDFVRAWFDDLVDLRGFGKTYDLAYYEKQARSIAYGRLTSAMTDKHGNIVGKSLADILADAKIDAKNARAFDEYLIARVALDHFEAKERGENVGTLVYGDEELNNADSIAERIDTYERENPTFHDASEELYEYQNHLLDLAVNSGLMDEELKDRLNELYPHYVPLYRVMDDAKQRTRGAKRGYADQNTPIARFKGSGRDIYSPIESIIQNTEKFTASCMRNDVMVEFANYIDRNEGMGWAAEKIPQAKILDYISTDELGKRLDSFRRNTDRLDKMTEEEKIDLVDSIMAFVGDTLSQWKPAAKQGKNVVSVMRGGKRSYYEVHDEGLYKALTNMDAPQYGFITRTFGAITRANKFFYTSSNPQFIFTNPQRDIVTGFISSTTTDNPARYLWDFGKAYKDAIMNSAEYKEYMRQGGGYMGSVTSDYNILKRVKKDVVKPDQGVIKNFLDHVAELVPRLVDAGESASRLAEWKRAMAQGDDAMTAMRKAQEVTVNFARGGRIVKEINQYVPFFMAGFNALAHNYDLFVNGGDGGGGRNGNNGFGLDLSPEGRKRRSRAWMKWLLTTGLLAFLTWLFNYIISPKITGESEEEVKKNCDDLSNYNKNAFYNLYIGDHKFFRVKKTQDMAIPSTIVERMVEYYVLDQKDSMNGLADFCMDQILPVNPFGGEDFVDCVEKAFSEVTLLGTVVDLARNKDFKGSPIVSKSYEYKEAEDQIKPTTSNIWVSVGKAIHASPIQLQYIAEDNFGWAARLVDSLTQVNGERSLGISNKLISDSAYSTDIINDLYDTRDEFEARKKKYAEHPDSDKYSNEDVLGYYKFSKATDLYSDLNARIRAEGNNDIARDMKIQANAFVDTINKTGMTDLDKAVADIAESAGVDIKDIAPYIVTVDHIKTNGVEFPMNFDDMILYYTQAQTAFENAYGQILQSGYDDATSAAMMVQARKYIDSELKKAWKTKLVTRATAENNQ